MGDADGLPIQHMPLREQILEKRKERPPQQIGEQREIEQKPPRPAPVPNCPPCADERRNAAGTDDCKGDPPRSGRDTKQVPGRRGRR